MTASALSDPDIARINALRWRAFDRQTVIAIAGAWNGGQDAPQIAAAHGASVGSITCTIGRLAQAGVTMRPSRWIRKPPERTPLASEIAEEHRQRLERLARFDPAAARCLDLIHGRSA